MRNSFLQLVELVQSYNKVAIYLVKVVAIVLCIYYVLAVLGLGLELGLGLGLGLGPHISKAYPIVIS